MRATLTTMATMNVILEGDPGLFMAPTGGGLTMERQDENIRHKKGGREGEKEEEEEEETFPHLP